jgi:hypothetical protein
MSDLTSDSAQVPVSSAPTRVNTAWIWILLGVPFLWLVIGASVAVPILVSQVSGGPPIGSNPLFLILSLIAWIGFVVCAYLDERYLKRLDIYKPFPRGWVFLSSLIYVIGRSVVVIRQTDRGRAPLWGAIVYVVLSIIATIVVTSITYNLIVATM